LACGSEGIVWAAWGGRINGGIRRSSTGYGADVTEAGDEIDG
jgi:hypothetical protein